MPRLVNYMIWRARGIVKAPVTFGVRCLVRDSNGSIVLLRHTYSPGWHFPGGAVDPGESAQSAAARELLEETGLAPNAQPSFVSLHWNKALAKRDHVALFRWDLDFQVDSAMLSAPAYEIADVGVFDPGGLPEGVSPSVVRRLNEILEGAPAAETW